MKNQLFAFIVGRPIWTTIITILLVVASAIGAQNLAFRGDYRVFFAEDDPKLVAYETVQSTFNKTDSVAFVIAPKDKNVFTAETLASIRALTEEAWQIPHSSRVDSITNFQHSWAEFDDLTVEDLVSEEAELTNAKVEQVKRIALQEPLLLDKIISPSGHVTVVNVTVQLNESDLEPVIMAHAVELQNKFMELNPNLDIMLSGMVAVNASFPAAAISDNTVLVPGMFLVVTLLMLLLLRNFSGTFSTVIVVIASIVGGMGLTGWLGINLSGPTASAPIMILTLAVADCIHVLSTMLFEMRQGATKRNALIASLKLNLKPILLTSITTAIGFMSMNFSESPPFRDLGNIVAIGVMLACVLSLTLFPALMAILPVRVKADASENSTLMGNLADKVIKNQGKILTTMSVIVIGLVALLPQNTLNDNFVEYFDPSTQVRQSADFMSENLSGIILLEVAVDSNVEGGISSPQYLQTLETFSQWFSKYAPEYSVMITGPDLMFAHIGQNNINSMLSGTAIALVLISVLIGFALRSAKYAAISLLPNLAPAAMGFGAWYLIDGQVGLGLSVVAGMTLGIVVDFTVHYLSKYLHAKEDKQLDTEQAVRYAFTTVGKALWVTTIVLVCGFIVMAQSTFKLNADMGFLTAVTIFIALIVDFFLLPPMLLLIDRKLKKKTIPTPISKAA